MQTQANQAVNPIEMTAIDALSLALEMLRDISRGKSFDSVAFYANVDAMQQALAKATAGRPRKLAACAICQTEMSAREQRGNCPGCGCTPAQRKATADAKVEAKAVAAITADVTGSLAAMKALEPIDTLRRRIARATQQRAKDAARLRRLQELDQRDPQALDTSERAEMARLLARSIAASKAVR